MAEHQDENIVVLMPDKPILDTHELMPDIHIPDIYEIYYFILFNIPAWILEIGNEYGLEINKIITRHTNAIGDILIYHNDWLEDDFPTPEARERRWSHIEQDMDNYLTQLSNIVFNFAFFDFSFAAVGEGFLVLFAELLFHHWDWVFRGWREDNESISIRLHREIKIHFPVQLAMWLNFGIFGVSWLIFGFLDLRGEMSRGDCEWRLLRWWTLLIAFTRSIGHPLLDLVLDRVERGPFIVEQEGAVPPVRPTEMELKYRKVKKELKLLRATYWAFLVFGIVVSNGLLWWYY